MSSQPHSAPSAALPGPSATVDPEAAASVRSRLQFVSSPPGSLVSIGAAPARLDTDPRDICHPVAHQRYQSPLRYPGAKSAMAPMLGRLISAATTSPRVRQVNLLVEPFAGGASASLRLVGDGTVERILLADVDPLVTDFWQAAAADTDRLVERMWDEWRTHVAAGGSTAVARWDYWRTWRPPTGTLPSERRLAMATRCLFLNRTTFSGILHGKAGPLGGRAQTSAYPIGCRWNPEAIEQRLRYVGHLYEIGRLVDVWRKPWRQTLDDVPEQYPQLLPSRVVAYVDPPYLEKSSMLYRASFDPSGGYGGFSRPDGQRDDLLHLELAEYLRRRAQFRWVLSYDNNPLLTTSPWLYQHNRMTPAQDDVKTLGVHRWRISKRLVATRYSAAGKAGKRAADELLITTLPASTVPADATLRPLILRNEPHGLV
jgi:DNA adenine methylase